MTFDKLVPGQTALKADAENAVKTAVESLLNFTGADMVKTGTGFHFRRRSGVARPLVRYQVTNATAGTNVVLAKRYDGTTTSGDDVAIRSEGTHANGDELDAYEPVGGTDATYAGQPVTWHEVGGGGVGSINLDNAGSVAVAGAAHVNIPASGGTSNVLEFASSTISGNVGGDLRFKSAASARMGIFWSGSAWQLDFVRAH